MPERRGLPPEVRAARAASVPPLVYPEELPVSGRREEIRAAIEKHQVVVVCGETGSGKTTQLPKICLEAGRGVAGYIGHTQPRRIAARTVAARIAEELKSPLGQLVGYKVRFQDRTRPGSLIKLMTDGILLAETQADRYLNRYDTLIVDEAHERSLNIDFLLGYLSWLLPRRPDFRLVITSATIDPERFSRHFGGAPIINVSGRSYPVDVRYRPVEVEEGDETEGDEQDAIAAAVEELWRDQTGDILVFLSGEREIRETAETLRKRHPEHCEILPLYSRLSQAEQDRVFRPSGRRRVVLATNVAETSLTVPGIRAVIDTGRARISRYSHRSRLQRLPIEKISRASAAQRSGRCGRVGPGIAIRLYSEEDFLGRPEFTEPEIHRTNLAAVILQMHALRLGDIERFPFVDPPDGRYVRDGLRTLQELGALDEEHRLTPTGHRLARLPVDPRLGRMLLAAAQEGALSELAVIVAALGVPDPRERPPDKQTQADQKHARFRDEKSDFLSLLKLWQEYEAQRKQLSRAKLRSWCRENFLSYLRMIEWHDIHGQIMEVLKGELKLPLNEKPADYPQIHRALLAGLLSQVCQRREQAEYLGTRGQKVFIHPGSGQFKAKPPWIVCAEQVETTKIYARNVARVEPEWVEQAGAHIVRLQHYEPHWERKGARVVVHERSTLFGLTLQSGRKVNFERIAPREARELFIRHALVQMDYDSKAPFFSHNLKLLEEADYLQQKGRRVDLLADEAQLYAFFDARVPPEVANGTSFEHWRKEAERQDPQLLFLRTGDIAAGDETSVDPWRFPDHLQAGPLRVALEYRFEPGHAEDGVTALVPLHMLQQLKTEPFQWLVPGLLEEKVTALVRVLPKNLRVNFVPVPEHAARALDQLDPARGGGLHAQLAAALFRHSGVKVTASDFREELLPPHLRMRYGLLDEHSRVVDSSRDLADLQRRHGGSAAQNFRQLAVQALLHTGCKAWDFGDLPATFEGVHDGQELFGHPALVDEGETVGVRLFPLRHQADASHRQGLIRLLRLVQARDIKPLRKDLAVNVQGEMAYRNLPAGAAAPAAGKPRDLREDVLDALAAARFLDGRPLPRTRAQFDAAIAAAAPGAGVLAQEISRALQQALESWSAVQARLRVLRLPAVQSDVEAQLGHLLFAGFPAVTPWARLREYPRYLKALLQRLDRAGQDPARDQKLAAEAQQWESRYWAQVKSEQGCVPTQDDDFRWLLEEYRVSLFAQQLKTAVPVSAKRLADAWQKRVSAGRS
ncbi:MAG TPA: ATP-dependent RNA helicase HrpA [Steroidobacteraceae bacterium]|nr:ATP-dependent RNA helicase HrpA [Steroidobacteraceae bacterium]